MNGVLHCIIKNEGAYWSARCLDFTLYAVGETKAEAEDKLISEIQEYLYEAIEGKDKEFAAQLLLRRAPYQDWLKYYVISFLQNCKSFSTLFGQSFQTTVPHGPYHHA